MKLESPWYIASATEQAQGFLKYQNKETGEQTDDLTEFMKEERIKDNAAELYASLKETFDIWLNCYSESCYENSDDDKEELAAFERAKILIEHIETGVE